MDKLIVIFRDLNGRMCQNSFSVEGDIFAGINKQKYSEVICREATDYEDPSKGAMARAARDLGYKIKYVDLNP